MTRLYGTTARYDGSGATAAGEFATRAHADGSAWASRDLRRVAMSKRVAAEIARFSLLEGTAEPGGHHDLASAVGPALPRLAGAARGHRDTGGVEPGRPRLHRRSDRGSVWDLPGSQHHLDRGGWRRSRRRSGSGSGRRTPATSRASQLSDADGPRCSPSAPSCAVWTWSRPPSTDSVSSSWDPPPASSCVSRRPRGQEAKPTATGLPVPFFGGGAHRRTTPGRRCLRTDPRPRRGLGPDDPAPGGGGQAGLDPSSAPRIQHGARWLLRLVDPGADLSADPTSAAGAYVDQLRGPDAVTPISGFLLPDHVDGRSRSSTATAPRWAGHARPGDRCRHVGASPPGVRCLRTPVRSRACPARATRGATRAAGLVQADITLVTAMRRLPGARCRRCCGPSTRPSGRSTPSQVSGRPPLRAWSVGRLPSSEPR